MNSCRVIHSALVGIALAGTALITSPASAQSDAKDQALTALQRVIAHDQANCPDEKIAPETISEVPLAASVSAVLVTLGSSRGSCYGNTTPTYLMAKVGGKWREITNSIRGITVKPLTSSQQAATIIASTMGMCDITYTWQSGRYVASQSKSCRGLTKKADIDRDAAELTRIVLNDMTRNTATASSVAGSIPSVSEVPPTEQINEPITAIANIIRLMDRRKLPYWTDKNFARGMQPYLTNGFIATVLRGGNIAQQRRYDIWDGDLVSGGAQGLIRIRFWYAKVVEQTEDAAIIDAAISGSDTNKQSSHKPPKPNMRYWLKKEDGAWKIDDLKGLDFPRFGPGLPNPSAKELFSDPDKYKAVIKR